MSEPATPATLAQLGALIRARRTVKAFTGAPVAREQLQAILDLARWAPNHHLREPWRFYVLERRSLAGLAAFLRLDPAFAAQRADARAGAKLTQLAERLTTAGALLQVTWMRAEDPADDREDHAATCAAIEHVLLGIAAAGLAGYWSTTAALVGPATLRWCGADPDREGAAGCLWVGHPVHQPPPPPRRPLNERVVWLDPA